MTKLIGLSGFKRSGKDTVAQYLKLRAPSGVNVRSTALADKLKVLAAHSIGFERTDEECIALMDEAKEDWKFAVYPDANAAAWHEFSGRELLQNLGVAAREMFDSNFWLNQVLPAPPATPWGPESAGNVLAAQYPGVDLLVVTDVRFPNEAQRVRALGGTVVEVRRPGTGSDGHASEIPLPVELIDYRIDNYSDLRNLSDEAALLLRTVGVCR